MTCLIVSHVWDHNRWSVICPFGCGYINALKKICLGGMEFLGEESCGEVLCKVAKCITAITQGIWAGQWQLKWPVFPQTKYLSSLDIILTMEGVSVAVNWCAALSFSISLMTSTKVWGSFSYILAVMVGASWRPLTKMQMATMSLSKAHH